jgi:hypothetical protein
MLVTVTPRLSSSSPPADVARAALLERRELLAEEARHLDGASYRRRCEIEADLAEVNRLLDRLGSTNKHLN